MEKVEKGIGILEKALNLVEKYKLRTVFKGCFIILVIAGLIGFLNNPTWIFDKIEEEKQKDHTEQLVKRTENNYKIQSTIEKLMYKTNASRCVIISLHNGLNDINNIPYLRGSAIYESLNDNVMPVSEQYQNVMLSLYPFTNHLYFNDYFCGDLTELKQIDKSMYHRFAANETTHLCAVTIQGKDKPIGFLFLTYTYDVEHSCNDIKREVQHTALELSYLLELNN
jgi:hypothetical protein